MHHEQQSRRIISLVAGVLLHLAIAHFGSSVWFSGGNSNSGEASTFQAKLARACGLLGTEAPPPASFEQPDAGAPAADEKVELSPQRTGIEHRLGKTAFQPGNFEQGELDPLFVSMELIHPAIGRVSAPSSAPQLPEDDSAELARQLADPPSSNGDLKADTADSMAQLAGVDQPPKALPGNPDPRYPVAAIREHREGRVSVLMSVSADGKVTHVETLKSSGWADVDVAALVAAKKWEFIPARRNGVAVAHEFAKPWSFRIED